MNYRLEPLLKQEKLQQGIERLAQEITTKYGDQPLTIVGVLTGSVIFLADLIRQLQMPLRVYVIQASSYRGAATTPDKLMMNSELLPNLKGQQVLVLDDIFDTGLTLVQVRQRLQGLGAAEVATAVLLRKLGRQQVDYLPDFIGFDIPDEFVVGYGLDYNDQHRHLPYVAAVKFDLDDPASGGPL